MYFMYNKIPQGILVNNNLVHNLISKKLLTVGFHFGHRIMHTNALVSRVSFLTFLLKHSYILLNITHR